MSLTRAQLGMQEPVVIPPIPPVPSKIQPITASVATNALTLTLNPTTLDFRSPTLSSGDVNTRTNVSAISLVVPQPATLGTISAQPHKLVVLALDNVGTEEIAVCNIAGGVNLDETTLISTKAIGTTCTFTGSIAVTTGILTLTTPGTGTFEIGQALTGTNVNSGTYVKSLLTGTLGQAGSTYQTNQITAAASTTITGVAGMGIYSTSARTSLPFRVVGYIESTQVTAGTWATAPSTIQGMGGQALNSLSSIGYGQTLQDVVGSRAFGTTYYNTTSRPILLHIEIGSITVNSASLKVSINGSVPVVFAFGAPGGGATANFCYGVTIIPPGASYNVTFTGTGANLQLWAELR